MRALVVYESIFGNTRAIAEAIAQGLRAGLDVEVVEVGSEPLASGFDLVVAGGPTHAWSMSRATTREDARQQARARQHTPVSVGIGLRDWLKRLGSPPAGALAATFDTAMQSRWFPTGSAARAAATAMQRRGYRLVAPPEQFRVSGTDGPLVDGELDRAAQWGARLAALCAPERAAATL